MWCREGELNPQGTKYRRILSPLRLPVPPSRRAWKWLKTVYQFTVSGPAGGVAVTET
jgi:hypothetical protein